MHRHLDQARQRERWLAASNALTTALLDGEDRHLTLQHIAEHARSAANASVAAIARPDDPSGTILRFDVVDADSDAAALVGRTLALEGTATGQAFSTGVPILVRDYGAHVLARQGNTDASLPTMVKDLDSAIAAPLVAGERRLGALTLARFAAEAPFTEDDVELVENFAHHAALVIEFIKADEDSRRLAILEDRNRIARDLHDVVIQRLYAAGLRLYTLAETLPKPDDARRANELVDEIDTAIQQIRASIFALEEPGAVQGDERSQLWRLAHGYADILGFEPWVEFDGPVNAAVPDSIRPDVHAAVRESLSNVARHASATSVYVGLAVDRLGTRLTLSVVDNGSGIPRRSGRRSGLTNLAARAIRWDGTLTVESEPGHGTKIVWTIDLRRQVAKEIRTAMV